MHTRNALIPGVLCLLSAAGFFAAGCAGHRASALAASRSTSGLGPATPHHEARNSHPAPANSEPDRQAYTHYAAGVLFDLNEQPDRALQEFSRATALDPAYEPLALEVARRWLQRRETDKALAVLKRSASDPESSALIYASLGAAYAEAGQFDPAVQANRTAIQKGPDTLDGYQNLAGLYLSKGRTAEALQVLDDAGRQTGVDTDFLMDLAEFYARNFAPLGGDRINLKPRIVALLNRVAQLAPADPSMLERLAAGYRIMGELSQAKTTYLQILSQNPGWPRLREKLIDLYLRSGDVQQAAEQLEAILRQDPANSQVHYLLGSLAEETKNYEKAADCFSKALLLNPDLQPAYVDLASAQLALEQPQKALATLSQARTRYPASFPVEYYAAMAQMQIKDYPKAIQCLTAAEIIARATDTNHLNYLFYFQLGAAYERNHDLDQAETNLRRCLELKPNFAEALNYLGYMWADQGVRLAEAQVLIEKALELEPENAAFLDSLGWVLFKLHQSERSLPYLLQAVKLNTKPDAVLFDHLGDIYASLQQFEKAREFWRKSLDLEPSDALRRKLDPATPVPER